MIRYVELPGVHPEQNGRFLAVLAAAALFGAFAAYSPLWAAIAFGVSAYALLVYLRPIIGVFAITMLAPVMNIGIVVDNPVRQSNEFIPLVYFAFLVSALTYALREAVLREINEAPNRLEGFFLTAAILFAIASLFWSIDPTHGVNVIFAFVMCVWMARKFPLIVRSQRDLNRVIIVFFITTFALIWMVILAKTHYYYYYQKRLFPDWHFVFFYHAVVASPSKVRLGGFAPVNLAANILMTMVFFDIYLMYTGSWIRRALVSVHILFVLYCLIKTASKAGLLSLLIGLALLPLIVPQFRDKIIRLGLFGMTFLGFLVVLVGEALYKRIERMQKGDFLDDRLSWWGSGFDAMKENNYFGLGAGGFPVIIDPIPAAHSTYLSVVFEYGYVGFAILMIVAFLFIRRILRWQRYIEDPNTRFAFYTIGVALGATALHACLDQDYNYPPSWFLLSLLLSMAAMGERYFVGLKAA